MPLCRIKFSIFIKRDWISNLINYLVCFKNLTLLCRLCNLWKNSFNVVNLILLEQKLRMIHIFPACSLHCTTYGCNITGADRCDTCDFGFGLVNSTGSCDGMYAYGSNYL